VAHRRSTKTTEAAAERLDDARLALEAARAVRVSDEGAPDKWERFHTLRAKRHALELKLEAVDQAGAELCAKHGAEGQGTVGYMHAAQWHVSNMAERALKVRNAWTDRTGLISDLTRQLGSSAAYQVEHLDEQLEALAHGEHFALLARARQEQAAEARQRDEHAKSYARRQEAARSIPRAQERQVYYANLLETVRRDTGFSPSPREVEERERIQGQLERYATEEENAKRVYVENGGQLTAEGKVITFR
jgi:hypothetical protein